MRIVYFSETSACNRGLGLDIEFFFHGGELIHGEC